MPAHKTFPLALALAFQAALTALFLLVAAKLFEYSLRSIFAIDVPWYGDLAGALLLNTLNLPIAIICWIANMAGAVSPYFG